MNVRIRIDEGKATLSQSRPVADRPVIRTALIEARGALLSWDAVSDARFPDAEIHSPVEAAGWLPEIYGADIAAAVGAVAETTLPLPENTELVDAVHRLAALTWTRDWWPAGIRTPALDDVILSAELAVAAHGVEHLLDDEDAVERALLDAVDAPSALAALPMRLHADAATLRDALTDLAEDHGVALNPVVLIGAQEWALAAGDRTRPESGIEIGHGIAPVRWADVPAQTVAADSDAKWSLRHAAGAPYLQVSVAAVPRAVASGSVDLWARFGPTELDIDIPLHGDGVAFTGEVQVAASVALLSLDDRTLWVRDRLLAPVPGPAETETDRDAVREFAVSRLGDPGAGLAERSAGG